MIILKHIWLMQIKQPLHEFREYIEVRVRRIVIPYYLTQDVFSEEVSFLEFFGDMFCLLLRKVRVEFLSSVWGTYFWGWDGKVFLIIYANTDEHSCGWYIWFSCALYDYFCSTINFLIKLCSASKSWTYTGWKTG